MHIRTHSHSHVILIFPGLVVIPRDELFWEERAWVGLSTDRQGRFEVWTCCSWREMEWTCEGGNEWSLGHSFIHLQMS